MNKKIIVGLSGGVDSAVCAYLLKEQGYEVYGVTMQMLQSSAEIEDAKKVAEKLGISFHVLNYEKEFNEKIVSYFIDEYKNGRTPNPCVMCNRHIKWQALLDFADSLGIEYVATGHYASIVKLDNDRYTIKMTNDRVKEQTYVLYNLSQEQLRRTIMPLSSYSKDEIRKIAESIGLEVANKPDSMDICFVDDNGYANFIKNNSDMKIKEGNFVDTKGNILGKHKGIIHYTIGQRKGLGIAFGKPMYVVNIDVKNNQVVLGENDELFNNELYCNKVNLMAVDDIEGKEKIMARIRYNHKGDECVLEKIDDDCYKVTFDKPQRAITKGQSVVFYKDDYIFGGGTII